MFSEPYFESINEYIRFSIIFCDGHLHYNFTKVAYTYFCPVHVLTSRFTVYRNFKMILIQ